jgi:NTE family protein
MHRIFLDREGRVYNAGTKISNDFDFFQLLRDHGRRAARRFLDEHFEQIGVTSTVDLRSEVPAVKG